MLGEVDVVFPVMHGPWGQDGTLQGLLEMAGVRYVGAGVLSSAIGTDKELMKRVPGRRSPGASLLLGSPREWERTRRRARGGASLGYPVFVKPARAGSSLASAGSTRPTTWTRRSRGLASRPEGPRGDRRRRGAGGGVRRAAGLGRVGPRGERVAEIRSARTRVLRLRGEVRRGELPIPATLDEDVSDQVRELAVPRSSRSAWRGWRGWTSSCSATRVVVNEVETMPGFTATSMFPLLWRPRA